MATCTQEDVDVSSDVNELSTHENDKCVTKMKLIDLKVVDLRAEMEKRNLDKNGVKSVLIDRLKEALRKEGENPDEYTFDVPAMDKTSKKEPNDLIKDINGEVEEEIVDEDISEDVIEIIEPAEESNQEINNALDATLQISIDEEEAQLNDDDTAAKSTIANSSEEKTSETSANETASSNQDLSDSQKGSIDKKASKSEPSKVAEKASTEKLTKGAIKSDKAKSDIFEKSIWITGLPSDIRAGDLKVLCSNQGKVLSVKIIKNTKRIPCRYYGYVTMGSSKEATKAIQNLHRVEVNGRVISVERATNEPAALLKRQDSRRPISTKKPVVKKETKLSESKASISEHKPSTKNDTKDIDSKSESKKSDTENENDKSKEKDKKPKEKRDKDKHSIRRSEDRTKSYLSSRYGSFTRRPIRGRTFNTSNYKATGFFSARQNRFPPRDSFREREEERRRALEHRFIERKQKEEALRLEREKEKLRLERELLERERSEILKLEREKQRLERERLEREREELRRVVELRRSLKRPFPHENLWDALKRPSTSHMETRSIQDGSSRYDFMQTERQDYIRQDLDRQPKRFFPIRSVEATSRSSFSDRDARRDVTMRSRDERQVISSSFKDRDNRRSFQSKDRGKRDASKGVWKQERRVHERVVSASNSGNQRRMAYY